jgi:hypothetical protein
MRRSAVLFVTLAGVLGAVVAGLTRKGRDLRSDSSGREDVVRLAMSELGKSEPSRYWDEVLTPDETRPEHSWCGAFALWVLRSLGLTDWTYDRNGAWFYQLPATKHPEPGDLAFMQGIRHLAIVSAVGPDSVDLVNGAGTGGKVTTSTVSRSAVTEFRSIAPLLAA